MEGGSFGVVSSVCRIAVVIFYFQSAFGASLDDRVEVAIPSPLFPETCVPFHEIYALFLGIYHNGIKLGPMVRKLFLIANRFA